MTAAKTPLRAIGLARQSRRDDDSLSIPHQVERITTAAADMELLDVLEEPGTSGGADLSRRRGLRRAVEMIEDGDADVIVAAYFDRFFRDLTVQQEVLKRIDAAGGRVLAVDIGEISNGTASQWISATTMGMVAEYHRRITREKTIDARRAAIARGVPTFPNVTPAYQRREDGTLEPHPVNAPLVADAVAMRGDGASLSEVQTFLADNGIDLKYSAIRRMLRSRILLGELHSGPFVNLTAHEPIVDEATWQACQDASVSRGRRAKVDRLLARMRLLRCGGCDAAMSVRHQQNGDGKRHPYYICGSTDHRRGRALIAAEPVEDAIRDAVIRASAGIVGRAGMDDEAEAARRAAERDEDALQRAFVAFEGMEDEQGARDRLLDLRAKRDASRDRYHRLRAAMSATRTVTTAADWDRLSLDARRDLIETWIASAVVAPGRGPDRLTIVPREIV